MKKQLKRFVSTFLLTITVFFFIFTPKEILAAEFSVTDPVESKTYNITQKNDIAYITGSNTEIKLPIADEIKGINCICGRFTFLCINCDGSGNYFYNIRLYNIKSTDFKVISTNIPSSRSNLSFCSTADGYCYILDTDGETIHIISQDFNESINIGAPVYQFLNLSDNKILVFAGNGTYSLSSDKLDYLNDITPQTPCVYDYQRNMIKASNGAEYVYENGNFQKYTAPEKPTDKAITDSTPQIDYAEISGDYIFISQATTFAKLYKALSISKNELKVYKPDGTYVTKGKLGTGMLAKFSGHTLKIIVKGDLTGEGNINSRDLNALMKHLVESKLLNDPYLTAADINDDKSIDTKDLLLLAKLYK